MKFFAGLSTFVVLALAPAHGTAQDTSNDKPNVTVATVASQQSGDRGSYVGRVQAVSTVDLQARIEGILEQRNFTEGGLVKKGDVLYVIEKGLYEASVDSAKATLEGAQATLKNSTVELERQKFLLDKGDVAQSAYDSAAATVGVDQSNVDQAKASLDTANINLGYTEIHAPIDGRISKSNIDVGNLVNSNSGTLATITSVDPIYVSFYMGERDLIADREQGLIGADSAALKVSLTMANGDAYASTGSVSYVGTAVEEGSDTVEIRATFDNPDNILIPGQFVNVVVAEAKPQQVLVVPQSAVQLDSKGHFVYLVDSAGKIERQDVKLGRQTAGLWEVSSGLKEGEKVVVQGLQRVSPGVAVNATELKQ
ncbi:efflux RND transporter periplasmic adaptor subunit [Hoeflea poritis]|uniref:Efflux RND transporter periplasmic adaptor subunit n=1 Tax=Hoeflea poritis TaxID=2993659 RepID=A0ABT4VUR9_9HYPH|nr:efflux RND transporter periplasmic adaptor subunit [Hoeflea poritis]MDA4848462.1 efflux RND transporter periplasmic adaptor subunit [Hoeflea poritis]